MFSQIKFFLMVCVILVTASCSSWYQIATISSNDVKMKDNGSFVYDSENMVIFYNFWSDGGELSFAVMNDSNKDICLDLSRSYFIWNGYAFDYFKNRTYVNTMGGSIGRQRSASVATTAGRTTTSGTSLASSSGSVFETATGVISDVITTGEHSALSSMTVTSAAGGIADMASLMKSSSIEYPESKMITIPARSAKSFMEYNVALNGEYRQCGLIRNPRRKETAVMNFSFDESPIVVENRLMFVIDGQDVPVNNIFYVSEFRNLEREEVIKTEDVKNCSGRATLQYEYNIFSAANRYYIRYSISEGYNGRIKSDSKRERAW